MSAKNIDKDIRKLVKNILSDIRVELSDEFDQNFVRQGFFSEGWQRRRSPIRRGGTLLVNTGQLRRSIRSKTTDESITFFTDLPYAEIHNDGGEIVVTRRMKKFFWAKHYEAVGGFRRKKDGSMRRDKKNVQLSDEAEFWKHMALMRVGKKIRIPRRRFLGVSPEVEGAVKEIIEENVRSYFDSDDFRNNIKFRVR